MKDQPLLCVIYSHFTIKVKNRMFSRQNVNASRPKRSLDRGAIILLVVFLVLAIAAAVVAFLASRNFFATTSLFNLENTLPLMPEISGQVSATDPVTGESTGEQLPTQIALDPAMAAGEPVAWDGTERITILVMGVDYRDWSEGIDIPRTDTMILFSIDPLTMQAGMFSVPRDMWVNIPGFGHNRINTAYPLGEGSKLPGGGPGLAMKTVEEFLGVPVNYYALLDFNSFVRFIDELGGLDMHIREEITVDPIGPGNTKTLEVGVQTLDGATALAYARMRYTKDGDFDRSKRQQEVIMALRDQVVNFNQLPMMVQKAPKLYQELASGIKTNLTLEQVIQLAWLAVKVDPENIQKGVLDPHTDVNYATVTGEGGNQDVLVPNHDRIRILRDKVFVTNSQYGPSPDSGDETARMQAEAAAVVFKNGADPANAARALELLRGQGVNIAGEAPADQAYSTTTVIDHTGNPYTINFIQKTLGLSDIRVVNQFDPTAGVDLEIMLGADYVPQ